MYRTYIFLSIWRYEVNGDVGRRVGEGRKACAGVREWGGGVFTRAQSPARNKKKIKKNAKKYHYYLAENAQ